jgi:hypothetical protein
MGLGSLFLNNLQYPFLIYACLFTMKKVSVFNL